MNNLLTITGGRRSSCSTRCQGAVHDFAPDGKQLPPNRDVIKAIEAWKGQGCLVVNMAPQPAGRVFNASEKTIHGIRVEMKR